MAKQAADIRVYGFEHAVLYVNRGGGEGMRDLFHTCKYLQQGLKKDCYSILQICDRWLTILRKDASTQMRLSKARIIFYKDNLQYRIRNFPMFFKICANVLVLEVFSVKKINGKSAKGKPGNRPACTN